MKTESDLHPRTLVVMQEPFNNICGAGITVSNLFGGWPKEKIASIYWAPMRAEQTVCEKQYFLTDRELRWKFPLNGLLPKNDEPAAAGGGTYRTAAHDSGSPHSLGASARSLARRAWRQMTKTIGGAEFMITTEISHALAAFVQEFAPEVIYCAPTSYPIISLVEKLSAFTGVPVIIHVYDDWLSVVSRGGMLQPLYGKKTTEAFTRLMKRSANRFAISEEMGDEYNKRFGMTFESFHNCPEPGVWKEKGRSTYETGPRFVFRFIGEIYYNGNADVLGDLSSAIGLLRMRGIDASLEIYTNAKTLREFGKDGPIRAGVSMRPVPEDSCEVAALCGSADGLIIAYDFDDFSSSRFRLSLPTKFPTYLLSGTPVVVYAPADLAVTLRALANEIAFVLPRRLPIDQLADQLTIFIRDAGLRKNIAARGSRYAADNLTAAVMRPRFRAAMQRSVDAAGTKDK